MSDVGPRVGVVFRPQLPPERLRDVAVQAEESGLDEIWLWEDCFAEGGLTTAAMALAWTRTLRVGLGLMPVPLRNVALAAMEVATLARAFPGRFVPAVGHGVLDWMEQVGARTPSPMGLLREYTQALRALVHGESVTVQGRYVRLDGVVLAWPPADPAPLLVGGRGPRTLALAGEVSDGVVLDEGIDPAEVGRRVALARGGASGPFEVVVYVPAGAGAGARARMDAEARAWGSPPPLDPALGSPQDVAAVLRRFVAAGATSVVLQPAGDEPDVAGVVDLAARARTML
jgi:alkanesulfonate monooxygenase SsuD/methylene tetrahydromethanopterin reductase-like flavin-dependent oxidoreductase (luciferase family)